MGESKPCFLCGAESGFEARSKPMPDGNSMFIDLFKCKECGDYEIHGFAQHIDPLLYKRDAQRQILSSISKTMNEMYGGRAVFSRENISEFIETGNFPGIVIPRTIEDKCRQILIYIQKKSQHPGSDVSMKNTVYYRIAFAKNHMEFDYYIKHLQGLGLLQRTNGDNYQLTPKGWEHIERNPLSHTCFVAMNFDEEFVPLYREAIKPAIEAAGYAPLCLLDREQEIKDINIPITDKIIAEIKQARFVIADFSGQKQNVYYEAGFARGLGLKVISCCQQVDVDQKKLAFDTSHYLHFKWNKMNLPDLAESLRYCIEAEIGRGPRYRD